jgi:hypothetical protein
MRVNIRAGNVLCECWPADPSIPCAASDPGFSVLRPDWMAIGPEDITAFRRGERVVDGIQTGCWNRAPLNDGTDDHHVHWPWELNARPFGLEVEESCATTHARARHAHPSREMQTMTPAFSRRLAVV